MIIFLAEKEAQHGTSKHSWLKESKMFVLDYQAFLYEKL